VRVAEKLEKQGRGLNLTAEVLDGIERHTTGAPAATLEGRIVRVADRIAYMNHDIEDAVRAGILSPGNIPASLRAAFGERGSERIGAMVGAVIRASGEDIALDPSAAAAMDELHDFLFDSVYTNPIAKGEEGKAEALIIDLFRHFTDRPEALPPEYAAIAEAEGRERAACDYIAGMSDNYALSLYEELHIPGLWRERDSGFRSQRTNG